MKTKILKFSIITAIIGIALWSCKKDEINTIQNNTDLLSRIELQTKEFNSSQNLIQAKINWKKVMKVAGSDLLGALAGGVSGATIGTAIPGVGNAAGATIGMIVGGVGGSLKAAGSISNTGSSSGNVGNSNNEFDYIGEQHINYLSLYDNNNTYFNNNELNTTTFYNNLTSSAINIGLISDNSTNAYTLEQLNNDLTFLDINFDENDFSPIINNLYNQNLLNTQEKDILILYFNSLLNTANFTDFVNYSIAIESDITNSNVSNISKQILLSTMSTTRWDVDYWLNANI